MKKIMQWVLAATLICGAIVFASCDKDNVSNLDEKIIGRWMSLDVDGQSVLTDEKSVYQFVSPTKAYASLPAKLSQDESPDWYLPVGMDVVIKGKKMTLTYNLGENTKVVEVFKVTAIDDTMFTANHKITVTENGEEVLSNEGVIRFVKVTDYYMQDILGTWECKGITGSQTHNDDNARLEFHSDGSYKYYRKDNAGEWNLVTNREIDEFFVAGSLLVTRWKEVGGPLEFESWEIESIDGDQMNWSALRQLPDGLRYRQGVKWQKVE